MLLAETSKEWKEARNKISPAFYKGKLVGMLEIARESMRKSLKKLKNLTASSESGTVEINMIKEVSDIFVRIIFMCIFGEDVSDQKVDFWRNGKLEKVTLAESFRETIAGLTIERGSYLHLLIFPFLARYYITPKERTMKANSKFLREVIGQIVKRRKI